MGQVLAYWTSAIADTPTPGENCFPALALPMPRASTVQQSCRDSHRRCARASLATLGRGRAYSAARADRYRIEKSSASTTSRIRSGGGFGSNAMPTFPSLWGLARWCIGPDDRRAALQNYFCYRQSCYGRNVPGGLRMWRRPKCEHKLENSSVAAQNKS